MMALSGYDVNRKSKLYRLMLLRRYYAHGEGYIHYAKYFVLLYGIASLDWVTTLAFGGAYAVASFVFGYVYIRRGFAHIDSDISNMLNPLFQNLEKHLNHNPKKKLHGTKST